MTYFLGKYVENYEDIIKYEETKLSKIYFAFNKVQNKVCSLKSISKEKIKEENYDFLIERINSEIQINTICKCKNVIELYKMFETDDYYNFEFEYYDENLYEYIIYKYGGLKSMSNHSFLRHIILDISKAIKVLNDHGIIHRDIKPQNIFINSFEENEKERVIKLGNFGCATFIKDNKSDPIGTIPYAAPEILENLEYNEKCDLWSLGVTLYELYFGIHPLSDNYKINMNSILENIHAEKFLLLKSNIPSFDILLNRLLQTDQDKRMSFNEFFDFVFDKNFMINENAFLENKPYYKNLYNTILLREEPILNDLETKSESCPSLQIKIMQDGIVSLIKYGNILDDINFLDDEINNDKKIYNNIIYFIDDDKAKNEIIKNIDYFENITHGAFILCPDFKSLDLIKSEIILKHKRNKNIIFNVIISSDSFDKVIEFFNTNLDFKKCIYKICIFLPNIDKFRNIKNKYNDSIYGIYNKQSDIKEFIEKVSSKDTKPFPITKLIIYNAYSSKYKRIHQKISEFYGIISIKDIDEDLENKLKLTKDKKEKKNLEKFKELINSLFPDIIELMNRKIIDEFIKEIFYDDVNNWMKITRIFPCEAMPYIISRFIFCLNTYGNQYKKYFCKDQTILRKGIKLPYTCLIPYIRAKGEIICFPSFILASKEEKLAKILSGREYSKIQYKREKLFSVIYIIKYNYKKNWIPNAIKVEEEPKNTNKKEIVLLAYSFYHVKDVKIDFDNYTADIYLETIGKTEILEEKIKLGKNIIYNEEKNIMEIKG